MTKKVKKVVKKADKKAKTDKAFAEFGKKLKANKSAAKKTSTAKKSAKKSMAKILPVRNQDGTYHVQQAEKESVKVSPVVDSTGTVVMKSIDDVGETTRNPGTTMKPVVDKETGVLTMVPVDQVK
jgi:hypothetical protein